MHITEAAALGRERSGRPRRLAGVLAATAGLALVLGACGSAASTSEAAHGGSSPGSNLAQAVALAHCMRAHGNGVSIVFPDASRNPSLPDAEQACRSKVPAGPGTARQ